MKGIERIRKSRIEWCLPGYLPDRISGAKGVFVKVLLIVLRVGFSYFEKVQAQEKKKPGKLSKIFSTHPPTADRIEKSQKTIATVLPDRDEYVLSTSEFDKIKAKLIALDNARKPAPGEDSKRPTLKRRTPTDDGSDEPQPSDDDRPTLKRRTPQAIS